MDVKYINPFLSAFTKTLEQLSITDIQRGGINKKSKLYVDLGLSTFIFLKGNIQGNLALSMSEETAKKLASTMMMGMSVSVVDDMTKSAIGELLSMIGGTATTLLSSIDVSLQISTPSVLLGTSDINSMEAVAFDYQTSVGKIELNISISPT